MRKGLLIIGILSTFLGLVMVLSTTEFIFVLVICIGLISVVKGVISLFSVVNKIENVNVKSLYKFRVLLNIGIGITAIILPLTFAKIVWIVVVYVLAAQLIFSAITELYGIIKMKTKENINKKHLLEIGIYLVLSTILIMIPISIGTTIIKILGVAIAILGVGCIVWDYLVPSKHELINIDNSTTSQLNF